MRFRIVGTVATAAMLLGTTGAAQAVAAPAGPAAACTWTKTVPPLPAGAAYGEVQTTDLQGGAFGLVVAEGAQWRGVASWKDGVVTSYEYPRAMPGLTPKVVDQNGSGTAVVNTHTRWVTGDQVLDAWSSRTGTLELLPEPSGYGNFSALGIADNGDITGYASTVVRNAPVETVVVRWPADRPGEVETVPGITHTAITPLDADDNGDVLFTDLSELGDYQEFVLRDGKVTALKGLKGLTGVDAKAISGGRVIGTGTYGGKRVGVLWDSDGSVRVLPNSAGLRGFSLNRNGMIVGYDQYPTSGKNNGFHVWQSGSYVTKVGGTGDIPQTVGDDGTVGGFTWTEGSAGNEKGQPALWRCR